MNTNTNEPADLLPAPGSSTYYGLRFADPAVRNGLAALYAVGRQVARIPRECSDPGVARVKLAWWEEELDRLCAGTPRHPLTRALTEAVAQRQLPRAEFQALTGAVGEVLERGGFEEFAQLRRHAAALSGSLARLSARLIVDDPPAAATTLGAAVQLTRALRDLVPEVRGGRLPLPAAALRQHGVTPAAIARGEVSEGLRNLLAAHAAHIAELFREGREQLPRPQRAPLRHLLVLARLHEVLLEELAADGFRTIDRHVALTPVRKLWIAWSAAGAARRGRLPGVSRPGLSR